MKASRRRRKRILIDIQSDSAVLQEILLGYNEWLKPRVNWEVFVPFFGTYSPAWRYNLERTARDIDGFLFLGKLINREFDFFSKLGGRVFGASAVETPGFWMVGHDNGEIGATAARYFRSLGIKNYTYYGSVQNKLWSQERCDGYINELNLPRDQVMVANRSWEELEFDEQGNLVVNIVEKTQSFKSVTGWLKKVPAGSGIFCENDYAARELLMAANVLGIDIPGKVLLLGVDNMRGFCESVRPQLSSIEVGWKRVGERLAELMVEKLSHPDPLGGCVLLHDFKVVERETTGSGDSINQVLRAAVRYLEQNVSGSPSLEVTAKAIGCSPRSLSRYFAENMHSTFKAEKQRIQLVVAQRLIDPGNKSVSAIAESCGFRDSSSFTRWYKDLTGNTVRAAMQRKKRPRTVDGKRG